MTHPEEAVGAGAARRGASHPGDSAPPGVTGSAYVPLWAGVDRRPVLSSEHDGRRCRGQLSHYGSGGGSSGTPKLHGGV
jgi:hypothetical protein